MKRSTFEKITDQGFALGRQMADGRGQKDHPSNLSLENTSPDFLSRKRFGGSSSSFQTSDLLPSALVAQRLLPSFDLALH
jgi:hypothetical protein